MKKHRRILTLILAMLLLFSAIAFVSAEPEEQEVVRLGEVQSLRETNSETFLLSDGSYECVVYAEDKYYLDDTDTLQLIDHTIKAETSGLNTTYTNTAGSFDATFSGSGTPQVSIAYEGNSITFSPLTNISLDDPITSNDHVTRIGKVENCLTLDNLTPTGSNTITYENAFAATDLTYVLDNHGVKEYIILNRTDAPNEFSFMFQLDGVEIQTIDNETFFMDAEGKPVFQLGQLFAVDGANELTNELTCSSTPVKGTDNVIVTVTLSQDYLSDPDRVFPVVIDPSIMISSVQTADTCVMSYYADYNYYTSSYLRTGYETDYGIRRSFIRFDIPSSIPDDGVTKATLELETCGGVAPTARAYRCTESWTTTSVTWQNQPAFSSMHYSVLSVPYREGSAWYVMDVTAIVQTWVGDLYANYGFAMKDVTENDPDHWTTYYSSDMESPHKPELHITYESSGSDEPDDPVDPPVTSGISLQYTVMDVVVGQRRRNLATTTPLGGTVEWYSSDPAIATVDSSGYVTGKKIGKTTITATSQGASASCVVYVTFADGIYYIRNKLSDKYMDIDIGNGGINAGTAIYQKNYSAEDTQRWILQYSGDGCYTICAFDSAGSYFLGINKNSNASTKPIVLRTGGVEPANEWRIEETSSGGYKLTSRYSSNYVLSLAAGTSTAAIGDGALLQKQTYTADTDYRDEWLIYQYNTCNLSVYFDESYKNKHASNAAVISTITEEFEVLKTTYLERFQISISYNTPTLTSTYASTNCSKYPSGPCTHGAFCQNSTIQEENGTITRTLKDYHHMNITNVMLRLEPPTSPISAKVLYIGHDGCYDYNSVHVDDYVRGLAYVERNVVGINVWENEVENTRVLVHEIGHLFGAPDHYGDGENGFTTTKELNDKYGVEIYNDQCIYGLERLDEKIAKNLTICAGCQEQIRKNANKYYEEP